MEENEKMTFDLEDFDKEWEEETKDYDEEVKAKLTEADKEFCRGFYYALTKLETAVDNVADDIDDETETLSKIKQEVIERAGKEIIDRMLGDFYDTIVWIAEGKE